MANKRMYSKEITDSDPFVELSSAAQALYFHLNQGADDDGFNNQVQLAMWKAHASIDDLKVLMAKNYILRFENGVIVIKHWRLHNTLRKDRYTPTNYQEEFKQLGIKDNGSYTLGCQVVANGLPDGCPSIDKTSVVESRVVEGSVEDVPDINVGHKPTKRFVPPAVDEVRLYCQDRQNAVDPQRFVDYYTSNGWMVGANRMQDWRAAARNWTRKETQFGKTELERTEPRYGTIL
jgi:hypothetical protein